MQVRQRHAMVALDVETLAAVGDGANEDRFPRPIVVARIAFWSLLPRVAFQWHEIEYSRREMLDDPPLLVGEIAGHRQGFEVYFRPHHGRAEIQHHAAF